MAAGSVEQARFLSSHHTQHTQIFRALVLQSSEHRSPRYTRTYTEHVLQSPAKHLFCPREKNERLVESLTLYLLRK